MDLKTNAQKNNSKLSIQVEFWEYRIIQHNETTTVGWILQLI